MAWMDPSQEQFTWWQVAHSVQGSLQLLCAGDSNHLEFITLWTKGMCLASTMGLESKWLRSTLLRSFVSSRFWGDDTWHGYLNCGNLQLLYIYIKIIYIIYIHILFLFFAGLDIAFRHFQLCRMMVVNLFWCWRGTCSKKPYIYTYMYSAARAQCLNLELLMLVPGDAVDSRVDYKTN